MIEKGLKSENLFNSSPFRVFWKMVFLQFSFQVIAYPKISEIPNFQNWDYGLNDLVAAKPLQFCNSTEFWSICEALKVPVDPLEAFRIFTTVDIKPWEEYKYVSLLAILERVGVDRGLKPHSSEIEKIEYTKELLGI